MGWLSHVTDRLCFDRRWCLSELNKSPQRLTYCDSLWNCFVGIQTFEKRLNSLVIVYAHSAWWRAFNGLTVMRLHNHTSQTRGHLLREDGAATREWAPKATEIIRQADELEWDLCLHAFPGLSNLIRCFSVKLSFLEPVTDVYNKSVRLQDYLSRL